MSELAEICQKLCDAELDRLTAAEICLDEIRTIMDRHRMHRDDPFYRRVASLSSDIDQALLLAKGGWDRRERLLRVRSGLTQAFPLSDADLSFTSGQHT